LSSFQINRLAFQAGGDTRSLSVVDSMAGSSMAYHQDYTPK